MSVPRQGGWPAFVGAQIGAVIDVGLGAYFGFWVGSVAALVGASLLALGAWAASRQQAAS